VYHDATANPDIDALALADADSTLAAFFGGLPDPPPPHAQVTAASAPSPLRLVLPELDLAHPQRHLLPYAGRATGWTHELHAAHAALPLVPIALDPLTVPDDDDYTAQCAGESNLPDWLRASFR
jgi:hypothetical protein